MPKVIAITPIKGEEMYEPGDSFECSAAQAVALCALGSAKMAGKREEAEEDETPKPKGKGK